MPPRSTVSLAVFVLASACLISFSCSSAPAKTQPAQATNIRKTAVSRHFFVCLRPLSISTTPFLCNRTGEENLPLSAAILRTAHGKTACRAYREKSGYKLYPLLVCVGVTHFTLVLYFTLCQLFHLSCALKDISCNIGSSQHSCQFLRRSIVVQEFYHSSHRISINFLFDQIM